MSGGALRDKPTPKAHMLFIEYDGMPLLAAPFRCNVQFPQMLRPICDLEVQFHRPALASPASIPIRASREATELLNIKSAEWPRAANCPHAHA
jgi:hypothetical protein